MLVKVDQFQFQVFQFQQINYIYYKNSTQSGIFCLCILVSVVCINLRSLLWYLDTHQKLSYTYINMKKIIISTFLVILSSSIFAHAQITGGSVGGTINGNPISISFGSSQNLGVNNGPVLRLVNLAQLVVSRLGVLMIGLGLLAFFWFLIQYIWKGDESADKRQEGLKGMGYSILALFVMVSIWGIIALMSNILGVGVGGSIPSLEMPKMK